MTALMKLLHLIFIQYTKQISIKTDMKIITQNVALLILK